MLTVSVPLHVWQHWRSSTSLAVASLGRETISDICDQITQKTDHLFGLYTLTSNTQRKQQLKDVLLECVEFKLRLERQANLYFFRWSCPGTPFIEEQMRSLTGVSSTKAVVSHSIWPMVCRGTSDNWTIVEKEVVQLIEPDIRTVAESELSADY